MASHSRNIRVDDAVWDRAKAYAAERGTTVTGLVVGYLEALPDDEPTSTHGFEENRGTLKKGVAVGRGPAPKTPPPPAPRPSLAIAGHLPGCNCLMCKPPKADK